jgi:hypothetical protein
MSITSVNISQSNITDNCNLVSVHNPLIFLVDVAYNSAVPELLKVDLLDNEDTLLETFACIPYLDTTGLRQFAFIANDILKGYMGSFNDFVSAEKVLEYCEGITSEFKLKFYDPADDTIKDEVSFVAMHSARQYGDTPYLESIYLNENETYIAGAKMPVYVYIYNNNTENVITVNTGELQFLPLLDYDDVAFLDFDGQYLTAI